jgi:hypothetical protein
VSAGEVFSIEIPMEAMMEFSGLDGGIVAECDIPVRDSGTWQQVLRYVRDGDCILVTASVPERRCAIVLPAVVIALHEEVPCIQVVI